LSRLEKTVIFRMNQSASVFDMYAVKRLIKDHLNVFQKADTYELLNSDAKILLENMGVIQTKGKIE
jgi:DNA mismatch repair ATPase MutS